MDRLIGLRWLLHALHPKPAQGDIREGTRDFHDFVYGAALDDAALARLLGP